MTRQSRDRRRIHWKHQGCLKWINLSVDMSHPQIWSNNSSCCSDGSQRAKITFPKLPHLWRQRWKQTSEKQLSVPYLAYAGAHLSFIVFLLTHISHYAMLTLHNNHKLSQLSIQKLWYTTLKGKQQQTQQKNKQSLFIVKSQDFNHQEP